ncbi:MAG TPA: hypothetical protein DDY39_03235, partial [Nitrospira sp.]|nr:hypothetical protein [Nitrospira sp.]
MGTLLNEEICVAKNTPFQAGNHHSSTAGRLKIGVIIGTVDGSVDQADRHVDGPTKASGLPGFPAG